MELKNIYEEITTTYNLNQFQKTMLLKVFDSFESVYDEHLDSFQYILNVENALVIYRTTQFALINIIINDTDCIAFSFIPNGRVLRRFYFLYPDSDFSQLAYDFLYDEE